MLAFLVFFIYLSKLLTFKTLLECATRMSNSLDKIRYNLLIKLQKQQAKTNLIKSNIGIVSIELCRNKKTITLFIRREI